MDHKNEQATEKPKGNMLHNENRSDEENPVEDTNVKTGNTDAAKGKKEDELTSDETD